jgi:hypothetical protein
MATIGHRNEKERCQPINQLPAYWHLSPTVSGSARYPAFPKVCCYLVGLVNIYEVTSL